jgi:hypothetical protein
MQVGSAHVKHGHKGITPFGIAEEEGSRYMRMKTFIG